MASPRRTPHRANSQLAKSKEALIHFHAVGVRACTETFSRLMKRRGLADNPLKAAAVQSGVSFIFGKNGQCRVLCLHLHAQSSLFLFACEPFGNLSLIYSGLAARNAHQNFGFTSGSSTRTTAAALCDILRKDNLPAHMVLNILDFAQTLLSLNFLPQ